MREDPTRVLEAARTVLLVDRPSRDVPESLARAGLSVVSNEGPDVHRAYVLADGAVQVREVERPERAELVYIADLARAQARTRAQT